MNKNLLFLMESIKKHNEFLDKVILEDDFYFIVFKKDNYIIFIKKEDELNDISCF